jgi:hypothetical protein
MVHEEHEKAWKNGKHQNQWIATLKTYAFPSLGDRLVSEIEGPLLRDVLAPIWLGKPETARRVRQRIGTVLDWPLNGFAENVGLGFGSVPLRLGGRSSEACLARTVTGVTPTPVDLGSASDRRADFNRDRRSIRQRAERRDRPDRCSGGKADRGCW